MRTLLFRLPLVGILGCLLGMALARGSAAPADEIEGLLHFIATLEGASLVRNGDPHSPKEAEAHLRLKWNQQKAQIRTAEDFIRLCGAKSSVSGKPYVIKFKDGHEEESAVVLGRQLAAMRTPGRADEKAKSSGSP